MNYSSISQIFYKGTLHLMNLGPDFALLVDGQVSTAEHRPAGNHHGEDRSSSLSCV